MTDRAEFEKARQIGLERRHEQRLARATYTAAEVKVLTETASKVAYALGRKDAGEEIALAITKAGDERSKHRHHDRPAVSRLGEVRHASYLDAATIARDLVSQEPQDTPEPRTDPSRHSDLPQDSQAVEEAP